MIGIVALIFLIIVLFYKFTTQPLSFWKERGVPFKKAYPLVGNLGHLITRRLSFFDGIQEIYTYFPNMRYHGLFQFVDPTLVIRDLDLIKKITVKDFDHFSDHRFIGRPESDPLFQKNILQLQGKKWKEMRATLSPAFTTNKMKAMFTLISECAEQLTNHYCNHKEEVIELEMKDLFTRYSNDVIATCAFGVKCDSIKERGNEFFQMGKDATDFSGLRGVKLLITNFSPTITKLFNFRIIPKYLSDYFQDIITETIKFRNDNNVVRPDMIHLLLEARKGKLFHEEQSEEEDIENFAVVKESSIGKEGKGTRQISDEDIAAQAFIFFFAGFDTASTLLSFLSYELGVNTDIQDKLHEEVAEVMKLFNGKPTYEAIMRMKYLDMVVNETLRKWPPAPALDRKCTKDYTIAAEKSWEKDYTIKAGETVFIPVSGLHRDEEYFPNPNKFEPERFSAENAKDIKNFSFIPFGAGPRACIASRFALMEVKVLVPYLLYKFDMVVIKKTCIPLQLTKKSVKMQPDGGFWLGLKLRKNEEKVKS